MGLSYIAKRGYFNHINHECMPLRAVLVFGSGSVTEAMLLDAVAKANAKISGGEL
jgi:hypothetical protein